MDGFILQVKSHYSLNTHRSFYPELGKWLCITGMIFNEKEKILQLNARIFFSLLVPSYLKKDQLKQRIVIKRKKGKWIVKIDQ